MFPDVQAKLNEQLRNGKYARIAALTVFAQHHPRIFEEGRAANGSLIGQYVEGPYKKKRAARGRETGFVNLAFTEKMKRDYQPTETGEVGYGFSEQEQFDKSEWNEKRYGKGIFELSQKEMDLFTETFQNALFGD